MSATNSSVWYRYPGSSFYILTNSVSSPRLYVQPSYYNQSSGSSNYPLQRVTIDEVEDIEEGYRADEELDDSFIAAGSRESGVDTVDDLKSCDEEAAIGNGDLDELIYSPISILSWLSNGTAELSAEDLRRVNGQFGGDIDSDESSEFAGQDGAAVGDAMEDEQRADLQLEINDEIAINCLSIE